MRLVEDDCATWYIRFRNDPDFDAELCLLGWMRASTKVADDIRRGMTGPRFSPEERAALMALLIQL
jgi:hypothetical protein